MKISKNLILFAMTNVQADESTSQMSHWDRLQQIIKSVYQNHQSVQASVDHSDKYFDENYCADRCVIHPSNRYTCGKARSAEHCSTVGCCWDENSQHCYKEAWDHCPRDRCEQINPADRATCAALSINDGEFTQKDCESAGCCFDSYHHICYDSSPEPRVAYPVTAECAAVEPEDRESCGFGLSKDDCATMTGCCWHVTDNSNHFCYKSILQTIEFNNKTEIEHEPEPRAMTIEIDQEITMNDESMPEINLKIANRGSKSGLIEYPEESISQKLQLWLNFISQLTQKIEDACDSKVEPLTCMNEAIENVLIPTCDELLFKTYGLDHVETVAAAFEMLEAIQDVLTWFCFDVPDARFCRYIVLSGFTLSDFTSNDENEAIFEANNRFDALVSLGKNGMLGTYSHSEQSKMEITDCTNTYLLIQTYAPARDEINQVDENLSESCTQKGACWKSMSFRNVIYNLYGDYNENTKTNFLGLYQSIAPLLMPGTGPLLANSVCIKPLQQQFTAAKTLMDNRFNTAKQVIEKSAGSA